MGLTTVPRGVARLEYSALRLPFTLLEGHVVARYWDDEAPFRLGFERLLGSLDGFAAWLLADDHIRRRGQALTRGTEFLAMADELETKGQARRAHADEEVQAAQSAARPEEVDDKIAAYNEEGAIGPVIEALPPVI